jgi:hypothetical protein
MGGKVRYAYDLAILEAVVSDIVATINFGTRLFLATTIPYAKLGLQRDAGIFHTKREPLPLPDIPPLPRKIEPLPPDTQQAAPPPLQSPAT